MIRHAGVAFGRFARATLIGVLLASAPLAHAERSFDVEIGIAKEEYTRISQLEDWLLGVFLPTDTIDTSTFDTDFVCVESSTGLYRINYVSQNGGPNLVLRSGAGDEMRYTVNVYAPRTKTDNTFYRFDVVTRTNTENTGQVGGVQRDCADYRFGVNIAFRALVAPADFNAAPPGVYTDLVTLVVTSE